VSKKLPFRSDDANIMLDLLVRFVFTSVVLLGGIYLYFTVPKYSTVMICGIPFGPFRNHSTYGYLLFFNAALSFCWYKTFRSFRADMRKKKRKEAEEQEKQLREEKEATEAARKAKEEEERRRKVEEEEAQRHAEEERRKAEKKQREEERRRLAHQKAQREAREAYQQRLEDERIHLEAEAEIDAAKRAEMEDWRQFAEEENARLQHYVSQGEHFTPDEPSALPKLATTSAAKDEKQQKTDDAIEKYFNL